MLSIGLAAPAPDHPGVSDAAYRARRGAISEVGARHRPGDEIATVAYAPEEDELWRCRQPNSQCDADHTQPHHGMDTHYRAAAHTA